MMTDMPHSPSANQTRVHTENAPRDCGPCNACCTAMHVRPLGKPAGERCQHQRPQGCGIYLDRPSVCREWYCLWVRDEGRVFDGSHRPDRLGVFFSASPTNARTGQQELYAHEIRPDAANEPKAALAIDGLRQITPVTIVPYPGEREPSVTQLTVNGKSA